MQGFIYSQLRGTPLEFLHDKPGCKFFCFSNIFRPNREKKQRPFPQVIRSGDGLCWLISSPNERLIQCIFEKALVFKKENAPINMGEARFNLESAKTLQPKLRVPCRLVTATPIVMRIPQYAFANYGISSSLPWLYWRPDIDFNAFIKQLEENAFKKFNEYNNTDIKCFPLFEQFEFKKATTTQIVEEGKNIPLHGSIWEFRFSCLSPKQQKVLQFAADSGLGEKNTLGNGFVNVVN